MTKTIRVENADSSNYKVSVEVWDLMTIDGVETPVLASVVELNNPAQLLEQTIWHNRYLIVKENGAKSPIR